MRIRVKFAAIAILLAFHFAFMPTDSWPKSKPEPEGLSNFGEVTETLFRGAQPSEPGFKTLKEMGVSIVVNFRDEAGETTKEKKEVESLGMQYVGIPWRATHPPSDAQVVEFLDLVRANSRVKIFVHCQRGADRTGTMIATFRIAIEHKPASDAISEMHEFHYAHFWLPGLEKYVLAFPSLLQTDSHFAAYRSSAMSAIPARPSVPLAMAPAAP